MPRILPNLIALFALAFSLLTVSPAAARYSEACFVKFKIEYPSARRYTGYYSDTTLSPVFSVKCNYLTGAELNARAGTESFADSRVYVVIVLPYSEPSYIRISQSLSLCAPVTETGCADSFAGRLSGYDAWYDRYGRVFRRSWDICQPGFIGRDCYRALGGSRR